MKNWRQILSWREESIPSFHVGAKVKVRGSSLYYNDVPTANRHGVIIGDYQPTWDSGIKAWSVKFDDNGSVIEMWERDLELI